MKTDRKNFDEKARKRLQKIIILMKQSHHAGERAAANEAATRLAALYGFTLDEAIMIAMGKMGKMGKMDESYEKQNHTKADAPSYHQSPFDQSYRKRDKWRGFSYDEADAFYYGFEQEKTQAYEKARRKTQNDKQQDNNTGHHHKSYVPRYRPSHYQSSLMDRFRLIRGLLLDGAGHLMTSQLTNSSLDEVKNVWLVVKDEYPSHQRLLRRKRMLKHRQRA